jgi:hypothetical protein
VSTKPKFASNIPHPGLATWSVKHHLLVVESQSGLREHPADIVVFAPGAVAAVLVITQLHPESLKIVAETVVKIKNALPKKLNILIWVKANI